MPRPTFIQSLLNRPSQKYSGPHAAPRRRKTAGDREGTGTETETGYHSVRDDMRRLAAAEASRSRSRSRSRSCSFPVPISTPPNTHVLPVPGPAPSSLRASHQVEDESVNGDSDDQVFFTPDGSPRGSCYDDDDEEYKDIKMEAHDVDQQLAATAVLPSPTLLQVESCNSMVAHANYDFTVLDADPLPLSLPNNSELESLSEHDHHHQQQYRLRQHLSSASSSTSSLDGASHTPSMSDSSWPTSFSAPSVSDMSRATTPATSENGHTRSSSSRSTSRSRRRKDEHRRMTYTDDDWAKDVRWLVGPAPPTDKKNSTASLSRSSTSVSSQKKNRNRTSVNVDPSSTLPSIPLAMRTPHRRTVSNSTTTSRRSMGKRRMSAVWEEDEGDEPPANTVPRRVHTDPVSLASLGRAHPSAASMHRAPERRSRSPSSMVSGETGSIGSSAFTSASRTVDIPVPLPVSDGGTPSGFTSLVLPRAAYTPSSNKRYSVLFGNSSHVDITRSGMAQTTMSTVSITKNATSSLVGQRPRFRSLSSLPLHSDSKSKSTRTPAHLLSTLPPPISFNSHTPPPSKVSSSQVLVQVYAVAVDGLDDRIVAAKLAKNDCYGFVPGRAFVGRVVEVGFEVNNVVKSDWLVGLLDVRKCGALAEFILVERRRITRCPRPSPSLTLEQLALLPLCGVPAHRAVHTCGFDADSNDEWPTGRALVLQGHDGIGALVVQALAKAGMHVTAHIPLFADRLPEVSGKIGRERKMSSGASSLCASSGDSEGNNDENENDKTGGSERRKPSEETEPSNIAHSEAETFTHTYTREAEERVRRWGARGVRVGDAVEVVENCAAGAFDVVIDTVGGKRIWDASQRVLASNGQFTTLVGDVAISPSTTSASASASTSTSTTPSSSCNPSASSSSESSTASSPASHSPSALPSSKSAPSPTPAIPSIPAHFRANLRSLRRSFGLTFSLHLHLGSKSSSSGGEGEEKKERKSKKKKKNVCYALVSPAADVDHYGEDVRDSLGAAVRRAGRGVFVPYVHTEEVGRVVPFERAPGLFGSGVLGAGRTAVVRIVD